MRKYRTKIGEAWDFLVNNHLFEWVELKLVTDLIGYSINTLNEACEARYAKNLEQLGFEAE